MHRLILTGLFALAAAPAPVLAQAQPPAAPGAQPLGGALIPGLCLLSQQAVYANAKIGLAATARIKQLSDQAQAEVDADRAVLEKDAKALDADTKIKPADKTARAQALNIRMQGLQAKADLRSREIESTRQKVQARIGVEETPIIGQVYTAHKCGLLIDRTPVLGGNMGGDLTAEVVKGLDAKATTISFDRDILPK